MLNFVLPGSIDVLAGVVATILLATLMLWAFYRAPRDVTCGPATPEDAERLSAAMGLRFCDAGGCVALELGRENARLRADLARANELLKSARGQVENAQADRHDWFGDVLAFHRKFSHARGSYTARLPQLPPEDVCRLRGTLIDEEVNCELAVELGVERPDLAQIADGIADSIYVLIGTALAYGIDLRPVWQEVQRSNMSKDGGAREDGKILKGPNWTPPDIAGVLARQKPIEV